MLQYVFVDLWWIMKRWILFRHVNGSVKEPTWLKNSCSVSHKVDKQDFLQNWRRKMKMWYSRDKLYYSTHVTFTVKVLVKFSKIVTPDSRISFRHSLRLHFRVNSKVDWRSSSFLTRQVASHLIVIFSAICIWYQWINEYT